MSLDLRVCGTGSIMKNSPFFILLKFSNLLPTYEFSNWVPYSKWNSPSVDCKESWLTAVALDEFEETNILFGIDSEEKVTKTESDLYQQAVKDTQNILDFSGYFMGDKAFLALIDLIEEEKGVGVLNIQTNNLTDMAIAHLCRSLEEVHHKSIELIDVSDNPELSDDSATALASLLTK